jgi:hypothetical protein
MGTFVLSKQNQPVSPTAGNVRFYFNNSGNLCSVDENGVVKTYAEGVTQEQVQDMVASAFQSTATITYTYNDAGNTISFDVNASAINHNLLQNAGTNTHSSIDSHIASTSNPHSVTKTQVGLSNCDNTSDANKPISSATQTALNGKSDTSHVHTGVYEPASANIQAHITSTTNPHNVTKAQVGLSNVPNTDATVRGNHTGTQLASTISDFAETTQDTIYNSMSFVAPLSASYNDAGNTYTVNLSDSGVVPTTYGNSSNVPMITVTPKGLVSSVTDVAISIASSAVTDFATTVRSTVLTGLSLVTNAVISASDTILTALGKLQAQISAHVGMGGSAHTNATTSVDGFMSATDKVKLDGLTGGDYESYFDKTTASITNSSNLTAQLISELALDVQDGYFYEIEWYIRYMTTSTTSGIALAMNTLPSGYMSMMVEIQVSKATSGCLHGSSIVAFDYVTAVVAPYVAPARNLAKISCIFEATGNGTLTPVFRSEVSGQTITVVSGSVINSKKFTV